MKIRTQHGREYFDGMVAEGRLEQVFEPQRHKTETYLKARELRRFIHQNPGKMRQEMPEELRGYLEFLCRKKMVTWKGLHNRTYFVRDPFQAPEEA